MIGELVGALRRRGALSPRDRVTPNRRTRAYRVRSSGQGWCPVPALVAIGLILSACVADGTVSPTPPTVSAGLPSAQPTVGFTSTDDAPMVPIGELHVVAEGFQSPTSMIEVDGRLLVAERRGTIRYIDADVPLLDISNEIGEINGERGLLGLAVHPDFPVDPRLYVAYSSRTNHLVVMSYVIADNGLTATSPRDVLDVEHPGVVHYAGHIAFGPDGYLYIALGDGGAGDGDPYSEAQNSHTLLGTILRIDVSAPSGYEIPPDNPFIGGGGAPEVWAYGFRNPWRFSFDRYGGDLWIGDVGETEREEVSVAPAGHGGLNFGWSRYEGTHCFRPLDCDPEGLTMPVAEYDHGQGASAVVGGYVYRGAALPMLVGRYLFGDIYSGKIWSIQAADPHGSPELGLKCECVITSFAEDRSGELYVLAFDEGAIYRLVPLGSAD